MTFTRNREGRAARLSDLNPETIQAWMDEMASDDLALSTMRSRQSTLSSLCNWLVKRSILSANPVAKLDRPPHRKEPPRQVPSADLMDRLIRAARARRRARDVAIFLVLRYTGMRRESVATLRVRNLTSGWGLRGVVVQGGKTRDIPLPTVVTQYLEQVVVKENGPLTPDTPLFWSSWGRPRQGKARTPMSGKNIWPSARPTAG